VDKKLFRKPLLAVVVTAACLSGGTVQARPHARSATIPLHAVLHVSWGGTSCPKGSSGSTTCYRNVGQGSVRGLGSATERYLLRAVDDAGCVTWRFTAALAVSHRGLLRVAARNKGCFSAMQASGTVYFTVTGGTGAFAHAQGTGSIRTVASETSPGRGTATDTWAGRLIVPG
jgi:hypothetical protein